MLACTVCSFFWLTVGLIAGGNIVEGRYPDDLATDYSIVRAEIALCQAKTEEALVFLESMPAWMKAQLTPPRAEPVVPVEVDR
jgi:hypothetical protein